MRKLKKLTGILLSLIITACALNTAPLGAAAAGDKKSAAPSFAGEKALYVHAVSGSTDTEAWQMWQSVHDEEFNVADPDEKFFFLPSSADSKQVDIYNGFDSEVSVGEQTFAPRAVSVFKYDAGETYELTADGKSYKLKLMNSTAEAAIYVNNTNADEKGTALIEYLSGSKSNSAKATGAIVSSDGKIDNTGIKKIKGRGNTTWGKAKKPFNITYSDNVSIAGMSKGKKYSLLANYQDDSLSRNRFLYDLADAVGMPYASDSRYVDFYSNGFYYGSYQLAEKIEVGKNSLISDFSEKDYLDADGKVKEDFPFLCEVDAGAKDGEDYYVTLSGGTKITIKAPELEKGDVGYNEVKNYVKTKFEKFLSAQNATGKELTDIVDVDSVAKLYLINELGKNWDAGVSSFYFTYKQGDDGNYKFYGSPVWDYDNSLGNANGIDNMLKYYRIYDYTKPTGIWCEYMLEPFAENPDIMARIKEIWFKEFVPAIDHFAGKKASADIGKELYTADEYYKLVSGTAEMNYKSGWLLCTSDWIADHSKLQNAYYDSAANTYSVNKYKDSYANSFEGMFNYARDWMISRAAWLSKEYGKDVKTAETENRPAYADVAEVVPSTAKTRTLRFYMPEDWKSEKNPFYNGRDLSSCKPGIYWWEGSYNCSDFFKDKTGWPGYCVTTTDKTDGSVYNVQIPEDVENLVFHNMVERGEGASTDSRSVNISAAGYEKGESEYYPDGLESVNYMVFVPHRNDTLAVLDNSDIGEWFYYYGNGRYGVYKNLSEAQSNNAVYSGGAMPEKIKKPIDKFTVSALSKKTYNGKAQTQTITLTDGDKTLAQDYDYTVSYKNNKNAGTATVTITGVDNYTGTITSTFSIVKAKNPVKVTAKKTVTAKSNKKTTIKKAVTVKNPKGKVEYKTDNKKITVKKGAVIVAKGLKKGRTVKVKITVTAKGNKNYKQKKVVKTIKVKVK